MGNLKVANVMNTVYHVYNALYIRKVQSNDVT